MTELERSAVGLGTTANASYDSAIDSLAEDYSSDLSVSQSHSSLYFASPSLAAGLTATMSAPGTTLERWTHEDRVPNQRSISPCWWNGQVIRSETGLVKSVAKKSPSQPTNVSNDQQSPHQPLTDYHRLYGLTTKNSFTTFPVHRCVQHQIHFWANKQHNVEKSKCNFPNQWSTSCTTSRPLRPKSIQFNEPIYSESVTQMPPSVISSSAGTEFNSKNKITAGSRFKDCNSGTEAKCKLGKLVCGQCQSTTTNVTVATKLNLPTSTSLRSSRSFTTSYRQRPNVTLIRRKSASERLAESRCRYIRSDLVQDKIDETNSLKVFGKPSNWDLVNANQACVTNKLSDMRLLLRTSTSTKSSRHSSSQSSLRFSPVSDHVVNNEPTEERQVANGRSANRLVDRIHSQLNWCKPTCHAKVHANNCHRKRISPKNSDCSNPMSNLEMQLRELIVLDNNEVTSLSQQIHAPAGTNQSNVSPTNCDKHSAKEEHIYRAELKYIASSSSSLSSMYSEPQNSLSLVAENNIDHLNIGCIAPSNNYMSPSVAPYKESYLQRAQSNVVRSKSDVSRYRIPFTDHTDRFYGSLALESDYPSAEGHISSSPSIHQSDRLSLNKFNQCKNSIEILCHKEQLPQLCDARSSNDEHSSLSCSKLSLLEYPPGKNQLNHSKSTSKLTFENLMQHQQSLTLSRSCHNLVTANQHTGPSVVERNARIIKWLFNCRKAMSQTQPLTSNCS